MARNEQTGQNGQFAAFRHFRDPGYPGQLAGQVRPKPYSWPPEQASLLAWLDSRRPYCSNPRNVRFSLFLIFLKEMSGKGEAASKIRPVYCSNVFQKSTFPEPFYELFRVFPYFSVFSRTRSSHPVVPFCTKLRKWPEWPLSSQRHCRVRGSVDTFPVFSRVFSCFPCPRVVAGSLGTEESGLWALSVTLFSF